jgi:hypothetical protein
MSKVLLTGTARNVTDSVSRAMAALKDRAGPQPMTRPLAKWGPRKSMKLRNATSSSSHPTQA